MNEWDSWEEERRVRRSMTLPVTVDPEEVTAEFKNGVLTLRMEKKKVKKGKEIKIK